MKYLAVGPPDARYAALTQGLVEAAVLGPPLDFAARKQVTIFCCGPTK